jgi:mannitol/fructose-specific phosphotransferase system IIA component (Ntr-type)
MIVELQGRDRWEVIGELINHLVDGGRIAPENRELISFAVRKREMSMSTGIGFGVAIPHASTDLVSDVIQVMGRSSKGIDFAALDGKPVHKVCLFLVPKGQFNKHLNVMADIAKRLHKDDF